MKISDFTKISEGFRAEPYLCPAGKRSIGYGRNLDDVGISPEEIKTLQLDMDNLVVTKEKAGVLLANDFRKCISQLKQYIPVFNKLDETRQCILIDMCYNMGIGTLTKFEKTIGYLEQGDFMLASAQMKASKWHTQVKNRAINLENYMVTGTGLEMGEFAEELTIIRKAAKKTEEPATTEPVKKPSKLNWFIEKLILPKIFKFIGKKLDGYKTKITVYALYGTATLALIKHIFPNAPETQGLPILSIQEIWAIYIGGGLVHGAAGKVDKVIKAKNEENALRKEVVLRESPKEVPIK